MNEKEKITVEIKNDKIKAEIRELEAIDKAVNEQSKDCEYLGIACSVDLVYLDSMYWYDKGGLDHPEGPGGMLCADHRKFGKISIEVSSMFISEILSYAHLLEPKRFDRFIDFIRQKNLERDREYRDSLIKSGEIASYKENVNFKEYKGVNYE